MNLNNLIFSRNNIKKRKKLNFFVGIGGNIDSARQNLASTFVNAFVNAGFGKDKLMTEDANSFLYKNKDHGSFL